MILALLGPVLCFIGGYMLGWGVGTLKYERLVDERKFTAQVESLRNREPVGIPVGFNVSNLGEVVGNNVGVNSEEWERK